VAYSLTVLCSVDIRKKVGSFTSIIYSVDMKHHRVDSCKALPQAQNGRMVREKVKCDHCDHLCVIGSLKTVYAYYTYHEEKLCRDCAHKARVI
jgi:hypothetical protein